MPQPVDILQRIEQATYETSSAIKDMVQLQLHQLNVLMSISLGRFQQSTATQFGRGGLFHAGLQTAGLPGALATELTSTTSPFSAIGNSLSKMSDLLLAIPHPAAMLLGTLGKIVSTAIKLPDIIQNFGLSLAKADMQFAKVSPAMALVEARQELRDVTYGMRMGRALAQSTEELNKSFNRLRNERFDIDVGFKRLQNTIAADLMDKVTGFIHFVKTGELEMKVTEMPDQPQRELSEEYKESFKHYQDFMRRLGLHGKPKRMQNFEGSGGDF